ncbi:PREDICTED: uncharacterized protein LOC104596476 [Nelumbo nucifera]|uniref:Uncharacterized protein LOC104596476 n=2 Tax=Nelumbo nucifera TaxID=4432 RepID=A0A1U8A3Y4_NELNU|nr:PREDICTED: uncharacterized protein LOC104596476 [Nelumbo nucifera]DAD19475.1 TPA_asm: hypothetical protein HUJ06_020938 [Nelumbo nucifera]
MAVSLDGSSPALLDKEATISMNSPPLLSPSSEKRFWSALRSRVDTLLENRKLSSPIQSALPDLHLPAREGDAVEESEQGKSLKEDCALLLRGFDSVASSLSQLTSNLDAALQGARDLAKPSLTELLHSDPEKPIDEKEEQEEEKEKEGNMKGLKRKCDSLETSENQEAPVKKENEQSPKSGKLKKARNLAVSMATKAAVLARELKSIKSDLTFMQERCSLLEEENRRLREGFDKGMRPEEDDLVRLQLEALLAEKSRLANENANLIRENQCLHQLVEYHQLTSQDLSESYEQVIQGICLDFSSPPPPIAEEANEGDDGDNIESPGTPQSDTFGICSSLEKKYCME